MATLESVRELIAGEAIEFVDLGFGPFGGSPHAMSNAAKARRETAPVNLEDALACPEADLEFLLAGGVFSPDQITDWIRTKRQEERSVRNRPHTYESPSTSTSDRGVSIRPLLFHLAKAHRLD